MKTLFKTYSTHQQQIDRRNKFENSTGLKWQYYSTGDGTRYTPIITKETPLDATKADALFSHLGLEKNPKHFGYRAFVDLARLSGIPLTDVLIGAKTLVKQGKAVANVNRMGGFASIRLKYDYEIKE